jgi:hypothetical protein
LYNIGRKAKEVRFSAGKSPKSEEKKLTGFFTGKNPDYIPVKNHLHH